MRKGNKRTGYDDTTSAAAAKKKQEEYISEHGDESFVWLGGEDSSIKL